MGRKGVGEEEESQGAKQGVETLGGKGKAGGGERSQTGAGRGRAGRELRPGREGPDWALLEGATEPGAALRSRAGSLRPTAGLCPHPTPPHPQPVRPPGEGGSRWDAVLCPPLSAASAGDPHPARLSGGRGSPGAGCGGRVLLEVAFAGGEETGPSELP